MSGLSYVTSLIFSCQKPKVRPYTIIYSRNKGNNARHFFHNTFARSNLYATHIDSTNTAAIMIEGIRILIRFIIAVCMGNYIRVCECVVNSFLLLSSAVCSLLLWCSTESLYVLRISVCLLCCSILNYRTFCH